MQDSDDRRIDDESIKALLEVKKGKTRKFVMIKEGVQIDKVYIFKRGPHDRYVKMARKEGVRGIAFWGVVRGDGVDIYFELSRADGFDQPPGKDIRLKEFLKEAGGLKLDPYYKIVDALPTVDESEESETAGDTATAAAPAAAADAQIPEAPPAPPDADQPAAAGEQSGDKFMRLLKKILPHVKRALASSTSLSAELQQRVREAQDLGRKREFDQGLSVLKTVGELAKQALAEASKSPKPAQAKAAAPIADAGQFAERLQQLRELCDSVQAASTSVGDDIAARFQTAETLAGRQKLDRAANVLPQIERLVDRARAEQDRRRQWEERLGQLEPRYNEIVYGGTTDPTTVRTIMEYAQAQAAQRQYVKGLVGLDRLETLLSNAS